MDLERRLIAELRAQAAAGAAIVDLIKSIEKVVGAGNRLLVIAYFHEAFFLTIDEAKNVGAFSSFEDGAWSAGTLESEIRPLLEATRSKWVP